MWRYPKPQCGLRAGVVLVPTVSIHKRLTFRVDYLLYMGLVTPRYILEK